MKNVDIEKRVAEIEGYQAEIKCPYRDQEELSHVVAKGFKQDEKSDGYWNSVFNPLLNDKLCFQLMKKHRLHLAFDHVRQEWCRIANFGSYFQDITYLGENLNKAVCLAIIEANEPN